MRGRDSGLPDILDKMGTAKKQFCQFLGKNVGLLSLPELKGDIYGLLVCESNMMLLAGISGDMNFFSQVSCLRGI